jgi:S1/P1 Nuclease
MKTKTKTKKIRVGEKLIARKLIPQKTIAIMLLAISLAQTPAAFAWGNEGHLYVNQVAAQKIPADMPRFLRRAVAEITYLGPEPDRWRSPTEPQLKNAQEPDHFIDLERVSWLDPLPATRYEFYRRLYEKRAASTDHPDDYLPEHVGLQPYITMEVFGRLKAAFREYRHLREQHKPTAPVEHAIVFYAGWLGHYVADGSQPLHTTIQYNGWTGPNPNNYTTQHKIHALFETTYVDANITAKDFSSQVHAPEHLSDPFHQYIAYLRDSNQKVEAVYALEKAGGFTGQGTPEARTFTTQRLAAGSQMLLNLWYTAWQDSAINPDSPHS